MESKGVIIPSDECSMGTERLDRLVAGLLRQLRGRLPQTRCAECGMPQPPEEGMSLHEEWCPCHNPDFCTSCSWLREIGELD